VFELAIRVVFSLAVVFGLIWVIARTSSRRFGGAARSMVRVVARQPLARSASLAVVEVGDRVLVVGVSENGVSLLTEMDPSELPDVEDAPAESAPGHPGAIPARGPWLKLPGLRTDRRAVDGATTGLNGSVLSTQTWRQAWTAATSRNGNISD
jgi:flagellar protein FliO/FliZ